MTPDMSQQLRVPSGMSPVRYKPPMPVHVPADMAEVPFIAPEDPAHKQVQQVWVAKTQVFNLGNKDQLDEYEKVWQLLSDGHGQVCEQRLEFDQKHGTFIAFLRYAKYEACLPGTVQTVSPTIPAPAAAPVNTVTAYTERSHAGTPVTITMPMPRAAPITVAPPIVVAPPSTPS